ncbi:MAG TPA: acyl-CoA dehydrogenase family protein [Mycobacteriales bacterium]|nr:acyl-CoA dehydrogenase family protein [Mycobacteriales bacterium]
MDFDDAPEDAAFRAEWRSWLVANADPAPKGFRGGFVAPGREDQRVLARAKEWQRRLADGGWGAIAWPKEHGGRAATPMQVYIHAQELAGFDVPPDIYSIGLGMIGPTLMAWGTEEQQRTYLPLMLDGSEIWCQMWSEPNAGSDIASLTTRGEYDAAGGKWLLNGQKIWTSGAHRSRWGLVIVRTDPDAPRHRGLSAFILDMHAPGVEIRPLREMAGGRTFNEVFLTDVEVPASNLVGPAGEGWTVALTTMAQERLTAGLIGLAAMPTAPLIELARAAQHNGAPAIDDPVLRSRLIDVLTRHRMLELTSLRTLSAMARSGAPGPESSTLKLSWSNVGSLYAELALDLLGAGGTLAGPQAPYDGLVAASYSFAPSFHIGGGTDEVQRSVIGEMVLGLPKEPKP